MSLAHITGLESIQYISEIDTELGSVDFGYWYSPGYDDYFWAYIEIDYR